MTDHGTPQFPRVEVDPIGQEMQSIALKSGCFDRSSDKMMKGFPGAAGPRKGADQTVAGLFRRSEEHTSELQSLMRNSYAVFCLKKKKQEVQNKAKIRKQ